MLFVCNGAPKSGTTWITHFFKFQKSWVNPTPSEFNDPNWVNPRLKNRYLIDLDGYDFYRGDNHYYTKVHTFSGDWAQAMLDNPDVRVLSIIRDVRDQLVSRYYHDHKIKKIETDMSFDDYFDGYARMYLQLTLEYNAFWYEHDGRGPVTTSYEYLQEDFDRAVADFVAALKLPPSAPFNVQLVKRKTNFSDFKITGEGEFMRKGIVGDYQNHMSEAQATHLEDMLRKGGYGLLKRQIANLHPELEPILARTDIGFDTPFSKLVSFAGK
ncbi:MAG: sulfotransferase domain-containing protein [Rhodospirillales bacterium]|nr:sulfotransferase domain-containing protein [Rhodospirillales bacterium]